MHKELVLGVREGKGKALLSGVLTAEIHSLSQKVTAICLMRSSELHPTQREGPRL